MLLDELIYFNERLQTTRFKVEKIENYHKLYKDVQSKSKLIQRDVRIPYLLIDH